MPTRIRSVNPAKKKPSRARKAARKMGRQVKAAAKTTGSAIVGAAKGMVKGAKSGARKPNPVTEEQRRRMKPSSFATTKAYQATSRKSNPVKATSKVQLRKGVIVMPASKHGIPFHPNLAEIVLESKGGRVKYQPLHPEWYANALGKGRPDTADRKVFLQAFRVVKDSDIEKFKKEATKVANYFLELAKEDENRGYKDSAAMRRKIAKDIMSLYGKKKNPTKKTTAKKTTKKATKRVTKATTKKRVRKTTKKTTKKAVAKKYGEVYRKKLSKTTVVVRKIHRARGDEYHVRVLKGAGLPANEKKAGNVLFKADRKTLATAKSAASKWLKSSAGKSKLSSLTKSPKRVAKKTVKKTATKKRGVRKTAKKTTIVRKDLFKAKDVSELFDLLTKFLGRKPTGTELREYTNTVLGPWAIPPNILAKTKKTRVSRLKKAAPKKTTRKSNPVPKIKAISFERYNGGVAIKRKYGSSTVTKFYVSIVGDDKSQRIVTGYGKTPGERKTFAKKKYLETKSNPSKDILHISTRSRTRAGKKVTLYYVLLGRDWVQVNSRFAKAALKADAVKVPWTHGQLPHHKPTEKISDRELGLMMHNWHASMGDPIYGAGSLMFAEKRVPAGVMAKALNAVRSLRASTWRARDKELLLIERNLEERVGVRRARGAAKAGRSSNPTRNWGSWTKVREALLSVPNPPTNYALTVKDVKQIGEYADWEGRWSESGWSPKTKEYSSLPAMIKAQPKSFLSDISEYYGDDYYRQSNPKGKTAKSSNPTRAKEMLRQLKCERSLDVETDTGKRFTIRCKGDGFPMGYGIVEPGKNRAGKYRIMSDSEVLQWFSMLRPSNNRKCSCTKNRASNPARKQSVTAYGLNLKVESSPTQVDVYHGSGAIVSLKKKTGRFAYQLKDRVCAATLQKMRKVARSHGGTDKSRANVKQSEKVKAVKIELHRMEGIEDKAVVHAPNVWLKANQTLARWAVTAPAPLAHDRTDCIVTFADGEKYTARYELSQKDMTRANLGEHIRKYVSMVAGRYNPGNGSQTEYKAWLKSMNVDQKAYGKFLDTHEFG